MHLLIIFGRNKTYWKHFDGTSRSAASEVADTLIIKVFPAFPNPSGSGDCVCLVSGLYWFYFWFHLLFSAFYHLITEACSLPSLACTHLYIHIFTLGLCSLSLSSTVHEIFYATSLITPYTHRKLFAFDYV